MSPRNQQDSSPFFQKLPPELRLEVYSHLFSNTRLSFGERKTDGAGLRLRPASNSLSLLRVCRRVSDEVGDSWLGQVLFSFEDPETMLDKLADLGPQTLAKLRHMRYSNEHPLELTTRDEDPYDFYRSCRYKLSRILKLLPGLCLDRLTVLGDCLKQADYHELDTLVNHSDGWKELYYLSSTSVMLGFGKSTKYLGKWDWEGGLRAPQPSTWNQVLTNRDGPTASVSIYRSSKEAAYGHMISKPATVEEFVGQVAEPGKESEYGIEEDDVLMAAGEKFKEVLVVARRGKGVDCSEKPGSPLLQHDIRENSSSWGTTWGQIRYMAIDWFWEELGPEDTDEKVPWEELTPDERALLEMAADLRRIFSRDREVPAGTEVDERGCPITTDTYERADDYEWLPSHLRCCKLE